MIDSDKRIILSEPTKKKEKNNKKKNHQNICILSFMFRLHFLSSIPSFMTLCSYNSHQFYIITDF